jgi:uncharacterized cupin superfamily protein
MPENRRHKQVVNIDEVQAFEQAQGGFAIRSRRLGGAAGGRALGCSHYELPPGKTAFPYHFHSALEEAIYVLEGRGTLRIGKDQVEVRAGDYVAIPAGPDYTHALTNSGTEPLRYLCMSGPATPATMDILGYPDSKKIAFAAGVEPGKVAWRDGAWIVKIIKEDQPPVGYYDDEPLAGK